MILTLVLPILVVIAFRRQWHDDRSYAEVLDRAPSDNAGEMLLRPVTFPPGRAKLATKPVPTGSVLLAITIGIV
jgi:hypothetical protein